MAVGDTQQLTFSERPDPVTGRIWTGLTDGPGFCYPLYFFGDTVTNDGQALVYYRWHADQVQNWKLDLQTGLATQLTAASTANCQWRFWDQDPPATGVRDQLSTLNPVTQELLYFDGNDLRAVHLGTLADRHVTTIPADREPCGIPGVSPSGRHLVLPHVDRAWWASATESGAPKRREAEGCCIDIVDLQDGSTHNVLFINNWVTHTNFYDERHIIFSNPPTECGLLLTSVDGGWYTQLCVQDERRLQVNHAHVTARGIHYETVSPSLDVGVMGEVDPISRKYQHFRTDVPISHRGRDPEGRLCFGDSYWTQPKIESFLCWFPRLEVNDLNPHELLTAGFVNFGTGQHSHLHPTLMPDRRAILFTGPGPDDNTNQIYLLDIADLADRETETSAN